MHQYALYNPKYGITVIDKVLLRKEVKQKDTY